MPAEDRVGRDDGCELQQGFPPDGLGFDGQQSTLIIGEQDPFLSQFLEKSLDLSILKLDGSLLVFIDPAAKDG